MHLPRKVMMISALTLGKFQTNVVLQGNSPYKFTLAMVIPVDVLSLRGREGGDFNP